MQSGTFCARIRTRIKYNTFRRQKNCTVSIEKQGSRIRDRVYFRKDLVKSNLRFTSGSFGRKSFICIDVAASKATMSMHLYGIRYEKVLTIK